MYVIKVGNMWLKETPYPIIGDVKLCKQWTNSQIFSSWTTAESNARFVGGNVMLITEPTEEVTADVKLSDSDK